MSRKEKDRFCNFKKKGRLMIGFELLKFEVSKKNIDNDEFYNCY